MNKRIEQTYNLLVVDGDENRADELSLVLKRLGYGAQTAADLDQMMMLLGGEQYDVLLLTARLFDVSSNDLLQRVHSQGGNPGVIIIADQPEIDSVLKALRGSVADYLIRPFGLDDLTSAIHRAVAEGGESSSGCAGEANCLGSVGKSDGANR